MGKFYEGLYEALSLFVRHSAWLNAAPAEQSRRDPDAPPPRTRLERIEADGLAIDMPPLPAGEHLIAYLWEIGPTTPAGMGIAAITHEAIRAWQDNVGIELRSWEARYLRRLSGEYLSAYHEAAKPDCPAPWGSTNLRARLTARSLQESIMGLSNL